MTKICLLGASGSIGKQTLEVIDLSKGSLILRGLSVGRQSDLIPGWLSRYPDLRWIYLEDENEAKKLARLYPQCTFFSGSSGLVHLVQACDYECLVSALSGFVGLEPTMVAIGLGKKIALANKETLVVAGRLMMDEVQKTGVDLVPIDSEHAALAHCLKGTSHHQISQLVITASGGSLRNLSRDQLYEVGVQEALAHPTWSMGKKITIDSASMVNKAFEIVEAHWLFGMDFDKISALVCADSKIHGLVEFMDGSWLLSLAPSTMLIPIHQALLGIGEPFCESRRLDLTMGLDLHLSPLDHDRYPLFDAMISCIRKGDCNATYANRLNEILVADFLSGQFSYGRFEDLLLSNLPKENLGQVKDLKELLAYDDYCQEVILEKRKKGWI